jgi:dimeric dUTPase (all-alpha-NTP-PPase superfamily)
MLTKNQLTVMLELQDKMNSTVNSDWIERNNAWLRAALLEGAEAIEHHGWKWWKKQDKDLPQLKMELVDIWHFALSHLLVTYNKDTLLICKDIEESYHNGTQNIIFDGKEYYYKEQDLIQNIELMIGLCVAKRFHVLLFIKILKQSDMSTDELYKQYVGKNILNIFRQNNGYKDGSYVKIWNNREDNEYLVDGLNQLNLNSASFSDDVYQYLEDNYPK